MAKKKAPARKSIVKKATRKAAPKAARKAAPTSVRKAAPNAAASAAQQILSLERRIQALEANPVLALAGVIVLEKGRTCSTVKVTGNLQIVNGMGETDTTNGCGNLIIGYNELPPPSSGAPSTRTGSHNLILGRYHSHASYAGLLAGEMNVTSANAPSSCVVGGSEGAANADRVVVVGGIENKANSNRCVIIGGFDNGANGGDRSVVVGGVNNRADAPESSIFGGTGNTTGGNSSTILGGSGLATTLPGERIP
jgi:hypothetical protein